MAQSRWRTLGAVPLEELTDERLQLHWASQIVSSVGATLLPPRPDDSHPSMEWLAASDVLAGNVVEGSPSFRSALHPASLTLRLMVDGGESEEYSLDGKTLESGYEWMESAIGRATHRAPPSLVRSVFELPHHPVADGTPFALDNRPAFAELASCYTDSDFVLQGLCARTANATPVTVWPHHFDLATLIYLDPEGGDPETRRSIGVGFVPGDGDYAEPYWYANPWPKTDPSELPHLEGGAHWHTKDWFGAVLPGSSVVEAGGAEAQLKRVNEFITSAIDGNRQLLGD